MAQVRNNIVIQGLSGSLGEQLVIRQDKAGRTIVSVSPKYPENRVFSNDQLQQQERFRNAVVYGRDRMGETIYVDRAKGTPQTSMNVAMADFFHAPEIIGIDTSNWHGNPGDNIRVQAVDNVMVTQVTVIIMDENNAVIEQGLAAQEGNSSWWVYPTTVNTSAGTQIVALAQDLPGNIAEFEWN
jgi:hypothetical protein